MKLRLLAPLFPIAVGLAAACSDDKGFVLGHATPAPTTSSSTSAPDAASSTTHEAPAAIQRCAMGRGALAGIADVVARINVLAPADGPCIVASLPRPLSVVASLSAQSAQPADGPQNPRILFLLPTMNVAAVPAGPGSTVVELGEYVSEGRTKKGEIAVPVSAPLAVDAPFTRVLSEAGAGTRCGGCHRNEAPDDTTAKAFVSDAFQVSPDVLVSVADLSALHDTCTQNNDPSERCTMLHAVFDVGEVVQGEMPADLGTFP